MKWRLVMKMQKHLVNGIALIIDCRYNTHKELVLTTCIMEEDNE